jgi:hypothetical protein
MKSTPTDLMAKFNEDISSVPAINPDFRFDMMFFWQINLNPLKINDWC